MAGGGGDDRHDADKALFRAAMKDVRRLQTEARRNDAPPHSASPRDAPPRPRPRARFTRADRLAVLAESLADPRQPLAPVIEMGDELQFRRAGVQELVYRKLRRGQYRVDAELDLHGLTAAQTESQLAAFLAEALLREWRVLRVVHGKGLRSGNRGPVLKLLVNSYLQRVGAVIAFASAREVDGGSGACLVLLASKRRLGTNRGPVSD
jgi:DNA-nicking Smr family endonuclease